MGNARRLGCIGDQSKQAKARTIGIVPQFSAETIWEKWKPLLSHIGQKTNICFQIKAEPSIPSFEEQIKQGRYDYAYMNPFHQVLAKEHYIPVIRNGNSPLSGVIIRNVESPIKTIQDADGKNLYLPAPNAFGASILVQQLLRNQKIRVNPIFVRTHTNVYLAVASDKDSIGGMILSTLEKEDRRLQKKVKIILQTKEHAPHPVSANKSIHVNERKEIQSTFISLSLKSIHSKSFEDAQLSKPVPANYAKDYKHLESAIFNGREP